MTQKIPGIVVGAPGPAGSGSILDGYGNGAPTAQTDAMIVNCQPGSTYRDYVGGTFWLKTTTGWVQK